MKIVSVRELLTDHCLSASVIVFNVDILDSQRYKNKFNRHASSG